MGKFLLCVVVLVLAVVGGWRFFRVSLQIGKLNNADPAIRQQAATQLGVFQSSRGVEPLILALNDTQPEVEVSAARSLGEIKDQRALEPLVTRLKTSDNYEVRDASAVALGSLGTPALQPLLALARDKDLGGAAGSGLVAMGAPAVDPLIGMLNENDPGTRELAADWLGAIRDPRADQSLITAADDKDEHVQQAAARALGQIADPQAVGFLLSALHDHKTDVIVAASDFFIKRGEPGSEDALIDALNNSQNAEGMATAFLNSGNQKLEDAAHAWASRNNYEITYMPGHGNTTWGAK